MGEHQRVGRPLRTDPEQFPADLPATTRELNAELNKLLTDAGLTHKRVVELTDGLDLTDKQRARQMGETPGGPSREFFDAIIATAADKLGRRVEDLLEIFLPLRERAQADIPGGKLPQRDPLVPPAPDSTGQSTSAIGQGSLTDKTAWLLTLLCDGKEADAAEQLHEVSGPGDSLLPAALVEVGRRLPGAVAALLDAVCEREGDQLGAELYEAIRNLDEEVAERIAAVPWREKPDPPEPEHSILDTDPELLFGRRIAAVIRRGDSGQASREVVAKIYDSRGTRESILSGLIEIDADGPQLVNMLLSSMAKSHREQMVLCVVQLLRAARTIEGKALLRGFDNALSTELRATILLLLSHTSRLPNTHGPSAGFTDLRGFLAAATPSRLITALTEEEILCAEGLAAGHLVEAVPDFGSILGRMTSARFNETATLLARALVDWETRAGTPGVPERYWPVQNLADTMLNMTSGSQLTGAILKSHPESGTLLFHAMQWLDHPQFPVLLEALANHVTIEALADTLISVNEDLRRLRIFEKLVTQTAAGAEPIIRSVVNHPIAATALLSPARKYAPPLAERLSALLGDDRRPPSTDHRKVAVHIETPRPEWFEAAAQVSGSARSDETVSVPPRREASPVAVFGAAVPVERASSRFPRAYGPGVPNADAVGNGAVGQPETASPAAGNSSAAPSRFPRVPAPQTATAQAPGGAGTAERDPAPHSPLTASATGVSPAKDVADSVEQSRSIPPARGA
ncbi:hypothetical protein DFR70_106245 [Nocardia tenerifensis]|uniref:Uncharacterized protein n=1 Tax=Nocardia tenerifensis TaxID=228006 RepID=A0A318JZG8_9NOCA|nr:hypothetical protein [Nocardia tenerifensis]PXX63187.1 hypothetical protein DFR70_106245 [Nocardia tenerifensis]